MDKAEQDRLLRYFDLLLRADGAALNWARSGQYAALHKILHEGDLPALLKATVGDTPRREWASELQIRCKRALGIAIRVGQRQGTLVERGGKHAVRLQRAGQMEYVSTYSQSGNTRQNMYHLAAMSDEDFESAIKEVRRIGRTTLKNVFRVAYGQTPVTKMTPRTPEVTRRPGVYTDETTQRTVITGAIDQLRGLATGIKTLGPISPSLTQGEREEWVKQLAKHRLVITQLINDLRRSLR